MATPLPSEPTPTPVATLKYVISPDNYNIDYTISHNGISNLLKTEKDEVLLNWVTFLDKIEKNVYYERIYSSVYYKEVDDDADYCSCTGDDEQELENRVKWIAQSNQFFNSSLIADASFGTAKVATVMLDEESENLKRLNSSIMVPLGVDNGNSFSMKWYIGPNEFTRLRSYGNNLEDIIPYGWSFFGTINRWVIRPLFNFLSGFIGNMGIVILLLTLLVKMALYPLTYKMLHSQSKMAALKPQLASMKEKFGDDPQKQQMETMKVYREFGVNPLGGCFPILLQMPIWFALYRFFPASIDFRQAGFLWADDLSSYDAFIHLPFELPFAMGAHISLFTVLWAVSTLIYTYYNSAHMDMSCSILCQ
jgi:YidC/Oxa1 family membrane protein insertase